jgi:hypothetical protein
MPRYNIGDIIIRQDAWGETIALVAGIETAINTFPDNVEYYKLLILKEPHDSFQNTTLELATWLVDKTFKIKI